MTQSTHPHRPATSSKVMGLMGCLSWRSLLILSGLGRAHGLAGLGRAHGLTAHRFPSTTIATAPRFLPAATPAARAGRAVRLQFAATANATRGQLDGDALQTPQRLSGLVAAFIQLGADINIILGRSVVSGSQAILSALPTAADRIADMVAQVVRALVRFLCLPLQLLGVIGLKLGSVVENMGHQASDVASSLVQQKRPPRAIIPFARRAASTPPRRPAATANVHRRDLHTISADASPLLARPAPHFPPPPLPPGERVTP